MHVTFAAIWTGKFRMLAIDYDRYLIVEHLNPSKYFFGVF